MATSRRRERELARRRFERRRQLEMERRAKAKKRNTWLGASIGTAAVIAVAVLLIVQFAGGSPKKPAAVAPAAASTAAPTPTPSPTTAPAAVKAPTKCAKISPNPTAKGQPTIPQPKGKLSKKLVVKDVKKGHGPAAKAGDNLTVTYIGVSCDTGTVFDATYKQPGATPLPVTNLGKAGVITGWNKGLIGVKAGGVRELVIPAKLAYGKTGQAPIAPNDTLVFLITVNTVKA